MSFAVAFIKDSLRAIAAEVNRQGEVIEEMNQKITILTEAKNTDPKKASMAERMAKVRAAKLNKKRREDEGKDSEKN